jgi:hypothetical protein
VLFQIVSTLFEARKRSETIASGEQVAGCNATRRQANSVQALVPL